MFRLVIESVRHENERGTRGALAAALSLNQSQSQPQPQPQPQPHSTSTSPSDSESASASTSTSAAVTHESTALKQHVRRCRVRLLRRRGDNAYGRGMNGDGSTDGSVRDMILRLDRDRDDGTGTGPGTAAESDGIDCCKATPAASDTAHFQNTQHPDKCKHENKSQSHLFIVSIPSLYSTISFLTRLADIDVTATDPTATSLDQCMRLIHPDTGQHSLLLSFRAADDARKVWSRVQNRLFHPHRAERVHAVCIAQGDIDEVEVKGVESDGEGDEEYRSTKLPPGYIELPVCPRCLSRLDSSMTDIVSDLPPHSVLRVKMTQLKLQGESKEEKNADAKADTDATFPAPSSRPPLGRPRRVRIRVWPEIQCRACQANEYVMKALRMQEENGHVSSHMIHCAQCVKKQMSGGVNESSSNTSSTNQPSTSTCSTPSSLAVTPSPNSVWLCLLCGHIGCGRYASSGGQHAFAHYQRSGHNFAMELVGPGAANTASATASISNPLATGCGTGTIVASAVWDYDGDGYIHRLQGSAATTRRHLLASAAAATPVTGAHPTNADSMSHNHSHDDGIEELSDDDAAQWDEWDVVHSPSHVSSATAAAGFSLRPSASSPPPRPTSSTATVEHDTPSDHVNPSDAQLLSDHSHASVFHGEDEEEVALLHSKLESIASFYSDLLTETLRRQYEFFMQRTKEVEEEDRTQRMTVEVEVSKEIESLRTGSDQLSSQLSNLCTESKALEKSLRDWELKCATIRESNQFLKALNTNLLQDQMERRKKGNTLASNATASAHNASTSAITTSSNSTGHLQAPSTPIPSSLVASPPGTLSVSSPVPLAAAASSSSSSRASSSSSSAPPITQSSASSLCVGSSPPAAAESVSVPSSSLSPSLVGKYQSLRDEKSKHIMSLQREVDQLMKTIEERTRKESIIAEQMERERKERLKRAKQKREPAATASSSSSGGGAPRKRG